jgi:hypothetical protein
MLANKMTVTECGFPQASSIASEAGLADFQDSHELSSFEKEVEPLAVYLLMVNQTPTWVNSLLSVRNKMARFVGLKDVGTLGGLKLEHYDNKENRVGMQLDIFTIATSTPKEMILVLNDKHLDIKLSILIQKENNKNSIFMSSIVKFHNIWGRLYMFVITPFHKRIVKRLLQNAVVALGQN